MNNPILKYSLLLVASCSAVELLCYVFRRYYVYKKRMKPPIMYEVLFFSDNDRDCREHFYLNSPCSEICPASKQNRLVEHILDCTTSVDVCIFLLTTRSLAQALGLAKCKGVKVRVICDNNMIQNTNNHGNQISSLERMGVEVCCVKDEYNMHHKFAVLDRRLVINGSANWTLQGFTGNWENIIITDNPYFAAEFSKLFDDMWEEYVKEKSISHQDYLI